MQSYTISELVATTGIPAATIHHYLREGLIPRPKRVTANRFLYDQRHVQALILIRRVRDQRGLSLGMIKRIIPELLTLEGEDAFRPEMWDKALAPRLARRRSSAVRLLQAAKDSFARRGYADVNVDDICRVARIAKGSFYRHHRSKEELFFAVAESLASDAVTLFLASTGPAEVSEEDAAIHLAPLMEPGLPVFLDLFARAVQGRREYQTAARDIYGVAAARVGQAVSGEGSAEDRGGRVIGGAIQLVMAKTLDRAGRPAATAPNLHASRDKPSHSPA
jgi:AcrR family transcriptional regulator